MAVSKLFTPVLRTGQGNAIKPTEASPIFVRPPTHPEIPVFVGPTDDGSAPYPLSLGGDRQSKTSPNTRRPVSTKPQEDQGY